MKKDQKNTVATKIQPARKQAIDRAVEKTIKQYGKTLVLLGKE